MAEKSSNVRLVDEKLSPTIDLSLIAGVEIMLDARVGSAVMNVAKLMELKAGDSVPLDAALNRDVELRLNGVTIATGELVTVGDRFGVRIVEIAAR